jgi:hypothetical protein
MRDAARSNAPYADFLNVRKYLMRSYIEHQEKNFDWILPRFDEGMRFALDEIAEIEQMTRRIVDSIVLQVQKIGSEFSDRFKLVDLDGHDTGGGEQKLADLATAAPTAQPWPVPTQGGLRSISVVASVGHCATATPERA